MSTGCNYITHSTKKWNKKDKKFDDVPVRCHKLTAENDDFCLKHCLFVDDEQEEPKRKEAARILKRNLKTLQDEHLAASPLAAVNPEYKDKKNANWMQGYDR